MPSTIYSKSEKRKDTKRKNILEAAAKAFSMKGYNETSIKDITDEASVSVGSFYSYFKNKEDIIEQLYDEISDMSLKIATDVSTNDCDNIAKKFTCSMTCAILTYVKNKELSRILLMKCTGISESFEKKRWEILDKTNVYLRRILDHLNKVHEVGIIDTNLTSVLLTHSIFGILSHWLDDRLANDLEDIIFTLSTYHLRALKIEFTDIEIKQYISDILSTNYKMGGQEDD